MPDSDQNLIPMEDAVAAVKLLGDVAGHEGDVNERKRLLMQRLKEFTDADGWLWSVTFRDASNNRPMSVGVIHEGLTDSQFSGWLEASQVARPQPPEDQPLGRELAKGMHYTRTRRQLVTDAEWYNSPTVKKYRLDRGIDDFLYSIYPLGGDDMCSAIGLFRHVGREPFADHHRRVTHIILSNVEWLHFAGLPEHRENAVPQLTPTQRMVLVYLLEGRRRSDIAELMHITENTAKVHVRNVLKFYDAKDQLDLVCKFRAGDGRDVV
ncbi:helix-turn-helix transcriptional regulator [Aeoliella mucimassa]|uniref:Bacterial regulatory protein, luxR family n=1 Tax=Aeoliella mucimassa TaxID=2527972 RepID=A0A518ALB5_9BACT|nr:helix-turn-helix transcriptional regulator [Aeoliella mucimassa]QDU55501.1 Bacterial regulatory protein, luxR family [Aeoliella mucimassa]